MINMHTILKSIPGWLLLKFVINWFPMKTSEWRIFFLLLLTITSLSSYLYFRQRLKSIWERVQKHINEQESRVRSASQLISGQQLNVWEWIKSNTSSPKKSNEEKFVYTPADVGLTECLKLRNFFGSDKWVIDWFKLYLTMNNHGMCIFQWSGWQKNWSSRWRCPETMCCSETHRTHWHSLGNFWTLINRTDMNVSLSINFRSSSI